MTDGLTVTYLEALPGKEETLREHLVSVSSPEGRILARVQHPEQFIVLEWRAEETDLALPDLLAAAPDRRHHEGLSRFGEVPEDQTSAVVVTHVDIVPAHKDEGTALVVKHVEKSAAHDGCLVMAVYAQSDRPNHMTLLEAWRDVDALKRHKNHSDTIDFRSAVLPLSGSLYDERVYSPVSI